MTQGIDRVGLSPQPPVISGEQGVQAQVVGQRNGEQVVVQPRSQESLIQNSLEELPAHLSEKASKKLAERSAKSRTGSRIAELLKKYTHASAPGDVQKYEKASDILKKLGKPTADQLKNLLKEQFPDQQSSALLFLEELFSGSPADADVLAVIREVKAELGAELQAFARDELPNFQSLGEVYQNLVGGHSENDFLKSADLMIQKLGGDLHAQGGSVEPAQLKSTLDSLYHLELARNTYMAFSNLTTRMNTSFRQTWADGAHRLMKEFLPLKEQRWLDGGKVRSTVDRLQLSSTESRIYFCRELYSLFGNMPDKAYPDHDARLRVTGAIQEALDVAINEEES